MQWNMSFWILPLSQLSIEKNYFLEENCIHIFGPILSRTGSVHRGTYKSGMRWFWAGHTACVIKEHSCKWQQSRKASARSSKVSPTATGAGGWWVREGRGRNEETRRGGQIEAKKGAQLVAVTLLIHNPLF